VGELLLDRPAEPLAGKILDCSRLSGDCVRTLDRRRPAWFPNYRAWNRFPFVLRAQTASPPPTRLVDGNALRRPRHARFRARAIEARASGRKLLWWCPDLV